MAWTLSQPSTGKFWKCAAPTNQVQELAICVLLRDLWSWNTLETRGTSTNGRTLGTGVSTWEHTTYTACETTPPDDVMSTSQSGRVCWQVYKRQCWQGRLDWNNCPLMWVRPVLYFINILIISLWFEISIPNLNPMDYDTPDVLRTTVEFSILRI